MFFKSLVFFSSFLLIVGAQSDNDLEIQAIKAHFSNAGIFPDLLPTFNPSALLNVSFDGVGAISPGQRLQQSQTQPTPNVLVVPANASVQLPTTYTLALVDAGPVGTDQSAGQTRHWLVNGATTEADGGSVSTSSGVSITNYAGPAPPPGSGAHRYVFLLYSQPSTFNAPEGLSEPNIGVSVFNLPEYVAASGLGDLVAGTYMTVEEGTASITPSATSPVITSTLVTSSGSQTTGTTSTTTTGAPSDTNAAVGIKSAMSVYGAGVTAIIALWELLQA